LERRPESIACRTGCRFQTQHPVQHQPHGPKAHQQRWDLPEDVQPFLLDLLKYRTVSNAIAADLNTEHQSPQLLLIRDGKTAHYANHSNIDPVDLLPYL